MAMPRLNNRARPRRDRSARRCCDHPYRLAVLALAVTSTLVMAAPAGAAPLPPNWPSTSLQIGIKGDMPSPRQVAPFGLRYQYLAGGAGSGGNWSNWNPNGTFVDNFARETADAGMLPVFTFYVIYQTRMNGSEPDAVLSNLDDAGVMRKYFDNLKLFFTRAASVGTRMVLHVEPDAWGFAQARSRGDDARTVPAKVGSSGLAELRGLPDNVAGVAQAVRKLRDTYARNVILGYHASIWGSGVDIALNDPSPQQVQSMAQRSAAFYRSLGTAFDLSFTEFTDRDAAFHQLINGRANAWWTTADYDRPVAWIKAYGQAAGQRTALWQIPLGNTKMRAMNNSWNHYQDNIVQTLLGAANRARLKRYVDAGVVAFLFGAGADGATDAHDEARDGTTNPNPINGNNQTSTSPADDGGYFANVTRKYYAQGATALPR